MGLVLFDLDGTVLNDDGAAAAAVEQWLVGAGWVDAEGVAGLVSHWDEIAERASRRTEIGIQPFRVSAGPGYYDLGRDNEGIARGKHWSAGSRRCGVDRG